MGNWKVRVDQHGNVDTAHLGNQLEKKAKAKVSSFIWGLIFTAVIGGIILLVFVGIVGYVYLQKAQMDKDMAAGGSGNTTSASKADWDGKSPYTCMGNDNKTIEGVTANLSSGTAITTMGNCKLLLKNCKITAEDGVDVGGGSQVTIEGGEIKSTGTAIAAGGAAKVKVTGTKVTGKVTKSGAATIDGVPVSK